MIYFMSYINIYSMLIKLILHLLIEFLKEDIIININLE